MTTGKSLEDQIADTLKEEAEAPTPYVEAIATLERTATAIQQSISPGSEAIQVRLEPSYHVNLGDQYRMVIRIPTQGFNNVLFPRLHPGGRLSRHPRSVR